MNIIFAILRQIDDGLFYLLQSHCILLQLRNNMNNTHTLQQKLEQALAYLGDKHIVAKDSKFVYNRNPVVLKGK